MHSFIHSFIHPSKAKEGRARGNSLFSAAARREILRVNKRHFAPSPPPCHVILFPFPSASFSQHACYRVGEAHFRFLHFSTEGNSESRRGEERDEGRLICRGVYRVISSCLANAGERSTRPKPRRERFNFTDQKFEQFGGRPKRISRGVAAACFAGDT